MHFRKIGIKSGIHFGKIGIKSGIHFGKIGIRNGYVFETLMAHPHPKSGQVPPPPGAIRAFCKICTDRAAYLLGLYLKFHAATRIFN